MKIEDQIQPFSDEPLSMSWQGLTLETTPDEMLIYGDLSITRDQQGLEKLQALQSFLKVTEEQLVAQMNLVPSPKVLNDSIKNPF